MLFKPFSYDILLLKSKQIKTGPNGKLTHQIFPVSFLFAPTLRGFCVKQMPLVAF